MNKMIKKFDNENGSALVIVMMVFVVVSTLGGALGMVTINSHNLAEHTQDSNSAYYIAEAGANMAYEEFKLEVLNAYNTSDSKVAFESELENVRGNIDGREYKGDIFQTTKGSQPSAKIEMVSPIEIENGFVHTIRSTGKVDGKARTVEKDVKVTWIDKGSGDSNPSDSFPLNLSAALTYKQTLWLNNGSDLTITGDIVRPLNTPKFIHNNLNHKSGEHKEFLEDNYRWDEQKDLIYNWINPLVSTRLENINITSSINHEKSYRDNSDHQGNIIHNTGGIIFEMNKTVNGDVKTNQGNIHFHKDGTVLGDIITKSGDIIIGGHADIDGDVIAKDGNIHFKKHANVTGDVIATNGEIIFEKGAEVYGSVIKLGDGKNLKFGDSKTIVKGNVISNGGEMQFENNVEIFGATLNPSSKIMLKNNVQFFGPVIVNELPFGNQTEITHTENYKKHFPFNMNTGNAGGTPGDSEATPGDISDIISSNPATEN